MRKSSAILTSGSVGRTLTFLALPMILGEISQTIYNLTDTYFISRLGTEQLAAMGFTFPVVRIMGALSMGLGIGTASVVSRAIGRGDESTNKRIVTDALILAVFLAVCFTTGGILLFKPLFTLLGASDDLLPIIKSYMSIWFFGVIFIVFPMIGNACIRATGNTVFPGVVMIISAVLNIILDPIFIFGLFGFPRMELAGAAMATVITRSITFIAALWFLSRKAKLVDFSVVKFKHVIDSWKQILYIAVPASTSRLLIPISLGIATRLAAEIGPAAVAAFGAGTRITSMAMVPLRSLSGSMIPFIGQNWGAGEFERVQRARVLSIYFSMVWGAFLVLFFWTTAGIIAKTFSTDPDVTRGIILFLWIDPLGYAFRGVYVISNSILNAINKPFISAVIMIIRLGVLYVPLAWIGMKTYGMAGMFAGMALANILSGFLGGYLARRISLKEQKRGIEQRIEIAL